MTETLGGKEEGEHYQQQFVNVCVTTRYFPCTKNIVELCPNSIVLCFHVKCNNFYFFDKAFLIVLISVHDHYFVEVEVEVACVKGDVSVGD